MTDPVFERYKQALKRGHVAVFRGRPKEALGFYQDAARLVGHRSLPWVSMGSVLLQMGRIQESIAAYDEALRRAPDDRQALGGKAVALTAAGRVAEGEAHEAYVESLDAQESRLRAEAQETALDATLGRGPERSLGLAAEAAARGDRVAAVGGYVSAAAAYQRQGDLDASLDACLRALLVAPAAPAIHLQMARVYLQRGWTVLAAERLVLLDRMLQLDDDPVALAELRALAVQHAAAVPALAVLAGGSVPPSAPGAAR